MKRLAIFISPKFAFVLAAIFLIDAASIGHILKPKILATDPVRAMSLKSASIAANSESEGDHLALVGYFGGRIDAIEVIDRYAYVGIGLRLMIFDIADPTNPSQVGKSDLLDTPIKAIAIRGIYAYITDGFANLYILNIANPANPVVVGSVVLWNSFLAGSSGYDIDIWGNYALVANGSAGLLIYDITDPANPSKRTSFSLPGRCYSTTIIGNYAYLAWGEEGLRILDISNPPSPVEVGTLDTIGTAYSVAVWGEYAYVADGLMGMRVINISDVRNPVEAGSYWITSGLSKDIAVQENFAYVSEGNGIRMIDISVPSTPSSVGFYDTRHIDQGVTISGSNLYIADYMGFSILQVTQPNKPKALWHFQSITPDQIVVQGASAYISTQWGLYIMDTSNPDSPAFVGKYACEYPSCLLYDFAISLPYAYLGTDRGIVILDVSNPQSITEVGRLNTESLVNRVVIHGEHAYIAEYEKGVAAINITNPAEPTLLGRYLINSPWDIAIDKNFGFITTTSGLYIIDITDPENLVEVNHYMTDDSKAIEVIGSYAVVALSGSVVVLDISDIFALKLVAVFRGKGSDNPIWAMDVLVQGDYAFFTGHDPYFKNVVQIHNIREPSLPALLDEYQTGIGYPALALEMDISGNLLYTSAGQNGLYVHQVQYPGPFTIRGRVADYAGKTFSSVSITSKESNATITGADGTYELANLPAGGHVISPASPGYIFHPASRIVFGPPDIAELNFTILAAPVTTTVMTTASSTAVYTDTQGLQTTIEFPSGAVNDPINVVITPTIEANISNFAFAGHGFQIEAFQEEPGNVEITFNTPVSITMHYSDQDVQLVTDESELWIGFWDNDTWVDAAETCTPPSSYTRDLDNNILSIPVCHFSRYSLFGPTYNVYLPVIVR